MNHEKKPWGEYRVLEDLPGHKVKRITVDPGGQLSLQRHRHRAEHWTVVRGMATVTVGATVTELGRSQSIDVPQGAVHRIENRGREPLDLIEIQFGDYLGEDDIIRYEDAYGRI